MLLYQALLISGINHLYSIFLTAQALSGGGLLRLNERMPQTTVAIEIIQLYCLDPRTDSFSDIGD